MIWNSRETMLDEVLCGIMDAEPGAYERLENLYSYGLARKERVPNKVQVIVNGGGGTGPMFPGLAVPGLADGIVSGEMYSAPNAYAIYELAKHLDGGRGVLLIANHFAGDFLNNDMAQELLATEHLESRAVYVTDDRFSCQGEPRENRGGLTGILQVVRVASAAAAGGMSLDEVYRIAQKTNLRMRSVSVCVREEEGRIELGRGFSGEPAPVVEVYTDLDHMAGRCAEYLMDELKELPCTGLVLTVNRNAPTTYNEGYMMLHAMKKALRSYGEVRHAAAGSYFPVFREPGFIVNVLALDQELQELIRPIAGYDFSL